jgi:two-component system response regulator AtoC
LTSEIRDNKLAGFLFLRELRIGQLVSCFGSIFSQGNPSPSYFELCRSGPYLLAYFAEKLGSYRESTGRRLPRNWRAHERKIGYPCASDEAKNIGEFFASIMLANGTNSNRVATTAELLPCDRVVFGCSAAMREIKDKLNKVVAADVPVLIEGEAGTGKELLAKWIHARSPRSAGPFVKVNCAAIPGTLLESELFGYEQGAFTGAAARKPGRVELAQGGTLFLDEIGEVDHAVQAKLLEFLQDGHFSRIGGDETQHAEARVVCATNRNLQSEIDRGMFRADLYYRINVVRIRAPRLRERLEDVPVLAEYLLRVYSKQFGTEREAFDATTISYLQSLSWPGNIRELSNMIARYVLVGNEAMVSDDGMRGHMGLVRPVRQAPVSLKHVAKEAVIEMERKAILEALRANHWNRRRAAQELKISYRALMYKIRQAGIGARRTGSPMPDPEAKRFSD